MNEATRNLTTGAYSRQKTRVHSKKAEILLCSVKAVVFTIAPVLIVMLICAAIYNTLTDPDIFIKPTAYMLLFISSLACGIVSAKLYGSNGLLCGLCSGLMLLALLMLFSVIISTPERGLLFDIIIAASVPLLSCIGGIFGRKQETRKSSKRKKRKK